MNEPQRSVDWQMTVADARCSLKSVYHQIELERNTRPIVSY